MLKTVKATLRAERDRRRKHAEMRNITRSLDALALTELGYPPQEPKRGWFYYR